MNDQQLLTYSRHILLPQIDIDGQQVFINSTALVIGCGGLGSPAAMYLAASGVGHLILADCDTVELSNLQRQIAHSHSDLGQGKAESAAATAKAINPSARVTAMAVNLSGTALQEAIDQADVVLDCSDNLTTRLEVNKLCYQQKTALVCGAAIAGEGQLLVVDPNNNSACYRCLYDETANVNLNCATSGVIAPLVGVIGAMQALEALKVLLGTATAGKLSIYDAWRTSWQALNLLKQPGCPVCGSDS
ncbi:HesA/MoeB/ThiF family protein [Halioxenophilus aromaticivorans]|uniref:Molybdopterin-synthase adenylyltransferase MoeB n=1 Tax=Halioxenophilus aromaticivorans TaxID=1306992 RepID=A0AAV3U6E8_9ALTE